MSWVQNYPNPAGAGMHRRAFVRYRRPAPEPRRRGDAPPFANCWKIVGNRTPQARGCTAWLDIAAQVRIPNPAGAGMHRLKSAAIKPQTARTPQARGCTDSKPCHHCRAKPNPAGAGMHRTPPLHGQKSKSEPRRRGDAPLKRFRHMSLRVRTPQARGCTDREQDPAQEQEPNPAGAGMHRELTAARRQKRTEPRRRGDAPPRDVVVTVNGNRTPQARGCTDREGMGVDSSGPNPAGAGMHRICARVQSP